MSAGLLLFGLATIWLLPVRNALLQYPLATVSVLVCIALIFKFAQQGGTAGLMTGGVLALYLIGVIVSDTLPRTQVAVITQVPPVTTKQPTDPLPPAIPAKPIEPPQVQKPPPIIVKPEPPKSEPQQRRTLMAAQGSILKFVAGVPYRLQLRADKTTRLVAMSGSFSFDAVIVASGKCVKLIELMSGKANMPFVELASTVTACGEDAVVRVEAVR